MKSRYTRFLLIVGTAGIVFLAGNSVNSNTGKTEKKKSKSTLYPLAAFEMERIPVAPLASYSPRDANAIPKEGCKFLVLALGEIDPNTEISSEDIDVPLISESGTSYKSVAFGFAIQDSGEPLMMVGQLKSGHMKIVGSKKSFVGLIYVVPKSLKVFMIKLRASAYSPPKTMRISNLLIGGEIEQSKVGDDWKVQLHK